MRTLNEMKDITETVLIATHDMQLVCEWAERIIVLCQGEVIADGSRNEIFGNRRVLELTGIRPPGVAFNTELKNISEHNFIVPIECSNRLVLFVGNVRYTVEF